MTTTIDRPTGENAATRVISANDGANIIISHGDYNVVGTRPVRHDGVDKVTGRATYGGDTRLNGLLFGKVLRSPHAPESSASTRPRHVPLMVSMPWSLPPTFPLPRTARLTLERVAAISST